MKENLITGKRLLIVAAVTAVTAGVVLTGIYFYPRLELKAETFPLEAGEALSEDVKAYADMTWKRDEKKASMDFSGVDPERPGSYEAAVVLSGKRYPFTIEVADTKAPEGTLKEEAMTVAKGTEVKAADLLSEVTDVTKVIVMFAEGDSFSETKTYKETGEFTETLRLTDEAGNSSELVQKIKVILPDETAPVIKGAKNLTVTIGTTPDYLNGVTAEDETDGDVTKEIMVDSSKADVKLPKVQQSSQNQQTGSTGTADQNAESAGTAPPPSQPESQSDSADFGNSQPLQPAPEPTPDQGSDNSGGSEEPPDWVDPNTLPPDNLTPEEFDDMIANFPL